MASVDDLRIDAPPPRPRRRGPSATPWVLLLGVAFFVWWMLGHPLPTQFKGLPAPAATPAAPAASGTGPTDPAATAAPGGAVPLETRPAPTGSFSAGGYVEVIPPGPRAVAPLFAGKVAKLHVVPGDVVHKGELLAEMDSSLLQKEAAVLQSRVELARSQVKLMRAGFRNEEVDDAQAAVDRAQARLTRAQADAAREDQLYQAGVTARASYDAARSELAQAQADLASARAQLDLRHNGNRPEDIGVSEGGLKVAQAELEQVRFNIGQCRITAPTDGMVYELFTSEGGWIDPADGGATHAALLSLFDPQRLQAYADVNQRDSARLSIGQAVELTADAAPQAPFKGMVERLAPQANLQKNTVRAIIRIPEVPTYLKPEMNLKVTFLQPAAAVAPPAPVSTGGTP